MAYWELWHCANANPANENSGQKSYCISSTQKMKEFKVKAMFWQNEGTLH